MVIYCLGQEEVGCKGRGHHQGSHAVSVLVAQCQNVADLQHSDLKG